MGAHGVHAQCCTSHELITLTGLSGDFCSGSSEKQQSCCKPPHSNVLLMCKPSTGSCSKTLNRSNYPASIVRLIRGKSLHLAVLAPSRQLDTRPGNDRKDDCHYALSRRAAHEEAARLQNGGIPSWWQQSLSRTRRSDTGCLKVHGATDKDSQTTLPDHSTRNPSSGLQSDELDTRQKPGSKGGGG